MPAVVLLSEICFVQPEGFWLIDVIVLELNIESENVLRSYQVPMQRVDEVFVA